MNLLSAKESSEMETVRDTQTCDMADTSVEHITATSHYKAHVIASLEDFSSSLDEILRTLLVSYTSKESNNLLLDISLYLKFLATCEVYCIMNSNNLVRIDTITVDADISCKLADGHHLICRHHSLGLKINHTCIYLIVTRTVV